MEKVVYNSETGEVTVIPFTAEEEEIYWQRRTPMAWGNLRFDRNQRLVESDAYVLPDRWSTYTPEQQTAWATYRQELRDLPANTTDPFNPVWPVKP